MKFATLGSTTVNDSYSDSAGITAIPDSKRLPCENYGTSNNIIIRFSTPFALGTGRTATLSLVDNNGNELDNWWVSMSAATLVSSMLYEFNVKTQTDLWDTPINDDNEDTYFDSTVQYRIKITLHDSTYDTNEDRIATFYMQPLIHFEFTTNTFSIDTTGQTDVELVYHIRTSNSSRLPDTATYGDPSFNAAVPNTGDCQVDNLSGLTITVSGPDTSTSNRIRYHVVADSSVVDSRNFTAKLKTGSTIIKTATASASKFMTIAGIHFWYGGAGEHGSMTFAGAMMPPIYKNSTTDPWSLKIYLKFSSPMVCSAATVTIPSDYQGELEVSKNPTAGTISTDVGGTHYNDVPYDMIVYAKVKDGNTLYAVNMNRVYGSGPVQPALYGTGLPIPITLTVPYSGTSGAFTTTFEIPLGPVIGYDVDNPLGGSLKPHNGEEHIVRSRGREWYWEAGSISDFSSYYYSDNTRGRSYTANFYYGSTTPIPEVSAVDPIKSRRTGHGFDITAPTTWQEGSSVHPDDWGAWKVKVIDETQLGGGGTMVVGMHIADYGSPQYSVKSWYPEKTINLPVADIVQISSIKFDDGTGGVTAYDINAIPLCPIAMGDAVIIEGNIPTASVITEITNTIPGGLSQPFTIGSWGVGSSTPEFMINIDVDTDLFEYNQTSGATFYTGQQIACNIHFKYVKQADGSAQTYDQPYTLVVGPVVRLNATSSNLKPAYDETTSVTINAKEYYLNGSNVQLQEGINCGGGINASTTNPNTGTVYALAWNYSGGTIGVAGSTADVIISSVSPSGGYTLKSNKNPEAPQGTITGTINIDTIQAYHWYDPAVSSVSVSQFQIVGARYWNGFDGSSDIFVDVGTNLNNIVIPGSMSREDVAARFTIFINCPTATAEGVEWELIVDNEGVAGNATWDINTDDSGNYNGHPYNCVAEFDWEFEPIDVNEEYPNSLWSGKAIPFSITQKISGVVQASISFTATMGVFGRIEINSPSATQVGLPGNEFEFIGRKLTVEYVNGSVQEIPSVLDESDIKIVLPGGLTTSDVDYGYDTNTGKFFIHVYHEVSNTYIRLAGRINDETFVEDWSYKTINFSSDWYLNFFTANASEASLSFFLAPTYSGVYGPNSNAPATTTYDGDIGTVNIVQDFASSSCSKSNA